MNRRESLRRLKQVLIRRRDALCRTLHGELEILNTTHACVVRDTADQAFDTDYATINSQLAETESRELEQIEHALERFRENQYGVCESCNRNIPLARLKALPYATTCIRCRKEAEATTSPTTTPANRLGNYWLRFDGAHAMRPAELQMLRT